jgi:5-methylcytosine-specific restriction endonuclease McrA
MKRGKFKKCERCGNKFYEYPYFKGKRKFCSVNCSNKSNANRLSEARKGSQNPMFGKKAWNSGVYGKIKHPTNQGKKCHFWRGGISRKKYKLRRGGKWKAWRNKVFERDDYTCQKCGKRGGRLIPHHIKLFSYFPKERFRIKNGITVCEKPCHKYLHRKENYGKRIININE